MRPLPHHRLVAYWVAVDLLRQIQASSIRDPKLRDEALRAAKSAVLNTAEGAGRFTLPDKNRAFTIARGEGLEAFAALETAAPGGDASDDDVARCQPIAERLYALLTGLIGRRAGKRRGGARSGSGESSGAGAGAGAGGACGAGSGESSEDGLASSRRSPPE